MENALPILATTVRAKTEEVALERAVLLFATVSVVTLVQIAPLVPVRTLWFQEDAFLILAPLNHAKTEELVPVEQEMLFAHVSMVSLELLVSLVPVQIRLSQENASLILSHVQDILPRTMLLTTLGQTIVWPIPKEKQSSNRTTNLSPTKDVSL